MIEVKIPGLRHGQAYIAGAYRKGSFVKKDGVFSQSDIDALGAANSNKPGYAKVGSMKLTQVTAAAAGQAGEVYPINKLIFKPEDSDASMDLIPAGSGVIFYEGGEYETDQYTGVAGAGSAFGDPLEITAAGQLTESAEAAGSNQIVAEVVKVTTGDSYNHDVMGADGAKDRLWFRLK